jgi:hypothetical protein
MLLSQFARIPYQLMIRGYHTGLESTTLSDISGLYCLFGKQLPASIGDGYGKSIGIYRSIYIPSFQRRKSVSEVHEIERRCSAVAGAGPPGVY